MTDRDLGFTAAFDELYARAFRVALRIVGERATAEDVAAEALTRAYDHWPAARTWPTALPCGWR